MLKQRFKIRTGKLVPWLRGKGFWVLCIVAFIIIAVLSFTIYKNTIGTDGTSYFSIADKYARGDFREAVNGYWSPLLSWLFAGFSKVGISHPTAFRIINLFSGVAIFFLVWGILKQFVGSDYSKYLAGTFIPLIGFIILTLPLTPDLLSASLGLAFLFVFIASIRQKDFGYKNIMLVAALGAASYLSKYFFLYFIVTYGLLMVGLFWTRNRILKSQESKFVLKVIILFLIFISPWVVLISQKYEHITTTTSTAYNLSLIPVNSLGVPNNQAGVVVLPNSTAASSWEDPSLYKVKKWSPIQSVNDAMQYIGYVLINTSNLLLLVGGIFSLALSFVLFGFGLTKRIKEIGDLYFYLIPALFVFFIGYVLFFIDLRYLWFGLLLLAAIASIVLLELNKRIKLGQMTYSILVMLMLVLPLGIRWNDFKDKADLSSYATEIQSQSGIMKSKGLHNTKVISNLKQSMFYCYYTQTQCVGIFSFKPQNTASILDAMHRYKIKYILMLKNANLPDSYLSQVSLAYSGGEVNLYRIR